MYLAFDIVFYSTCGKAGLKWTYFNTVEGISLREKNAGCTVTKSTKEQKGHFISKYSITGIYAGIRYLLLILWKQYWKIEGRIKKRKSLKKLFTFWTTCLQVRDWNGSICLACQKEDWAVTWLGSVRTFRGKKHQVVKVLFKCSTEDLPLRKCLALNPHKFRLRSRHKYLTVMVNNHWYYWSHYPSLKSLKLNLGTIFKIYFVRQVTGLQVKLSRWNLTGVSVASSTASSGTRSFLSTTKNLSQCPTPARGMPLCTSQDSIYNLLSLKPNHIRPNKTK